MYTYNKFLGDANLGTAIRTTNLGNNTLGQILLFLFYGRNRSLKIRWLHQRLGTKWQGEDSNQILSAQCFCLSKSRWEIIWILRTLQCLAEKRPMLVGLHCPKNENSIKCSLVVNISQTLRYTHTFKCVVVLDLTCALNKCLNSVPSLPQIEDQGTVPPYLTLDFSL